jgi:hypothetical protein
MEQTRSQAAVGIRAYSLRPASDGSDRDLETPTTRTIFVKPRPDVQYPRDIHICRESRATTLAHCPRRPSTSRESHHERSVVGRRAGRDRAAGFQAWRHHHGVPCLETSNAIGGESFVQFCGDPNVDNSMYLSVRLGPDRLESSGPSLYVIVDFLGNVADDVVRLVAEVRRQRRFPGRTIRTCGCARESPLRESDPVAIARTLVWSDHLVSIRPVPVTSQ